MDKTHWKSPTFRERSPHQRPPRFRGEAGIRNFSPHQQWRPRGHSPFRPQTPLANNFFSPQLRNPFEHDFMTSTPHHGRRPYHHRGGGARFNKRASFGSPLKDRSSSSSDIDNWISSEMWSDPWRYLTGFSESKLDEFSHLLHTPQTSNTVASEDRTNFADTDFDVSESVMDESKPKLNTENEACNRSPVSPSLDFDASSSQSDEKDKKLEIT